MKINRIRYLVEKYISKELSADEYYELLSWYRKVSFRDVEYPREEFDVKSRVFYRLMKDTGFVRKVEVKQRKRKLWYASIAAACLVFLSVGGAYYFTLRNNNDPSLVSNESLIDYSPGTNNATLTLPNGERIALASDQERIIIHEGEVSYPNGMSVTMQDNKQVIPLELSTPRGGTYQVTLPDGTKVWLNAASALRYPSRFSNESRIVELLGEAYFEVAHDVKPFIVKANRHTVKVLGTKFNLSAYQDEFLTATTLVEGRVLVSNGIKDRVLSPGEQSIGNELNELKIAKVNVKQFLAWKNGYFDFTDKTIDQIIPQLERWYNVDIIFQGEPPSTVFFGSVDRSSSFATVLALLETNNFDYKIVGRKLFVQHKEKGGLQK